MSDEYYFLNADSACIQGLPVDGFRSGIGFQILFDNRDRIINPLKGSLIELNNLNYGKFVGSDYRFNVVSLDARQYINPFKNQTLALRVMGAMEFTDDQIPMRALARVGGHKFIRGYFKGTYQDQNMVAFEPEYRLPFWPEGTNAKLWQVWKRLGVVGFVSGAQVFHEPSDFQWDNFNLAVGGGIRVLFNPQSRVNLRFDYAVGLRKGSDGQGERQSGFYFFLGEAF
jgi:outer membrane protein assembly factor BamA